MMKWMVVLAVFSGGFLGWLQVEGLRRNVRRLLNVENAGDSRWGSAWMLRWAAIGLLFWIGMHVFKANLFAFVLSFLISGFVVRHWLRRNVYAP